MRKLLLSFIICLSLCSFRIYAQNRDTMQTVNLTSINEKLDNFIQEQNDANEALKNRIVSTNERLQDIQNHNSFRWIYHEIIPLLILIVIGGFITLIIYIVTLSIFRNRKLLYETVIRCTEMTGSVPEAFTRVETSRVRGGISNGKVHLLLSVLCCVVSLILFISTVNLHGSTAYVCGAFCVTFAVASVLLFIQFNQRSLENNRTNQQ